MNKDERKQSIKEFNVTESSHELHSFKTQLRDVGSLLLKDDPYCSSQDTKPHPYDLTRVKNLDISWH